MNEEIEALFPFYALGTLDEVERAQVEAYLAENPEAAALLEEMVAAAELLPFAAEPAPPAAEVKEKLMARVREDARSRTHSAPAAAPAPVQVVPAKRPARRPRLRWSQALPALATVAVAVALIVSIWALSLSRQVAELEREVGQLQTEMQAAQAENTELVERFSTMASEVALLEQANEELRQQLASQEQILAILTAPESRTLALGDAEVEQMPRGTLTVNEATQTAVVSVANLEPLDDRVYQLWLIQDGEPISAGVFEVDGDGRQTLIIPYGDVGPFEAIGVSIEPEGGSDEPTGEIVLLEEVSF